MAEIGQDDYMYTYVYTIIYYLYSDNMRHENARFGRSSRAACPVRFVSYVPNWSNLFTGWLIVLHNGPHNTVHTLVIVQEALLSDRALISEWCERGSRSWVGVTHSKEMLFLLT